MNNHRVIAFSPQGPIVGLFHDYNPMAFFIKYQEKYYKKDHKELIPSYLAGIVEEAYQYIPVDLDFNPYTVLVTEI